MNSHKSFQFHVLQIKIPRTVSISQPARISAVW